MRSKNSHRVAQWIKTALWTASVAVISAGTALFIAGQTAEAAREPLYRKLDLFGEVLETVRRDYVEPVEDEKLVEAAIRGILSSLDPHSAYLDPKSYHNMQIHTRGEFGGLGLEVTMEKGLVKVVAPIAGTPAEAAGMLAGDFITHLDGKPILGMTLAESVEKMRGKPKTSIILTVRREGRSAPLQVTIIRDIIRVIPVRYHTKNDIGYIRINTFSEQTEPSLHDALRSIQKEIPNPIGYILDLRNNPGGLLDQAVSITDAFLAGGEVVSTRGRDKRRNERYNARAGDLIHGKPLIVMINGGSASASEIVAGALQDHRRAVILGTLSFGKGSVQTIRPLSNGHGALRLTTARYYTPSGKEIQARGVEPDIIVQQKLTEEDKHKLGIMGEASLRQHLDPIGTNPRSGSASYVPRDKEKDTQYNYAMKLIGDMHQKTRTQSASATASPALR